MLFKSFRTNVIAVFLMCFFWLPALTFDLRLLSQPSDTDVYLGAAGLLVLVAFAVFVIYFAYRVLLTYHSVSKDKN